MYKYYDSAHHNDKEIAEKDIQEYQLKLLKYAAKFDTEIEMDGEYITEFGGMFSSITLKHNEKLEKFTDQDRLKLMSMLYDIYQKDNGTYLIRSSKLFLFEICMCDKRGRLWHNETDGYDHILDLEYICDWKQKFTNDKGHETQHILDKDGKLYSILTQTRSSYEKNGKKVNDDIDIVEYVDSNGKVIKKERIRKEF